MSRLSDRTSVLLSNMRMMNRCILLNQRQDQDTYLSPQWYICSAHDYLSAKFARDVLRICVASRSALTNHTVEPWNRHKRRPHSHLAVNSTLRRYVFRYVTFSIDYIFTSSRLISTHTVMRFRLTIG
jgi:hypothetical protein